VLLRDLAGAVRGDLDSRRPSQPAPLRSEGYRLQLLVDCKPTPAATTPSTATSEPETARPTPTPAFRIDGEDLSFLRSIGIDPTRRRRRRSA
jgi:hypothetical protein